MVLAAMSREFREGLPNILIELPYVDDLIFRLHNRGFVDGKVAKMEDGYGIEGCESEYWKEEGHEVSGEQGTGLGFNKPFNPCSVCKQGFGCNLCVACHRWVHKGCNDSVRLMNDLDLQCIGDILSRKLYRERLKLSQV